MNNPREMLVFISAFAMSQALNLRYSDGVQIAFATLGSCVLIYTYFTGVRE